MYVYALICLPCRTIIDFNRQDRLFRRRPKLFLVIIPLFARRERLARHGREQLGLPERRPKSIRKRRRGCDLHIRDMNFTTQG